MTKRSKAKHAGKTKSGGMRITAELYRGSRVIEVHDGEAIEVLRKLEKILKKT